MAAAIEPLDLVDIAVLLNYERATTEELFRDTKLREVAYPGQTFRSASLDPRAPPPDWRNNDRTWIALEEVSTQEDRQLPDAMPSQVSKYVPKTLTEQQLETIFYRTRAFDSCRKVVELLQEFFALFPANTKLRIRHAPKDKEPGTSYVTSVRSRRVFQDVLVEPKFSTVLASPQWERILFAGTGAEMRQCYMAFYAPDSGEVSSILDLSSMQFGEVGRGPGKEGKMLFVLEEKTDYEERLKRIAGSVDLARRESFSHVIFDHEFLGGSIVRTVKERWEKRDTEKWCGYCGAPEPKSKCGGCRNVWFCNKMHQKMMWSFHKGYCNKG
jgi:hypothetical protein